MMKRISLSLLLLLVFTGQLMAETRKISIPVEIEVSGSDLSSCIDSATTALQLNNEAIPNAIIEACEEAINGEEIDPATQVVADLPAPQEDKPVTIKLKVHGFLHSGNQQDYYFNGEVEAEKDLGKHFITAKGYYGLDGRDTEEAPMVNMGASINDDIDLTKQSVIFFYTHLSRNEKKGEELRQEGLVGFGTTLWGDDYHGKEVVKASIGLGEKHLRTEDGEGETSALVSLRLKSRKKITGRLGVKHVLMVKIDPADSEEWEADNYVGFTIDEVLGEAGSLNIGVESTYVNEPAPGREELDHIFKIEFQYKW